jgi:putative tryptophan/tyrosine transport system substrate-binding protein
VVRIIALVAIRATCGGNRPDFDRDKRGAQSVTVSNSFREPEVDNVALGPGVTAGQVQIARNAAVALMKGQQLMHTPRALVRSLSFIVAAGVWLAPASNGSAAAQGTSAQPALAQDGRGLFDESAVTQDVFRAVWADRAPAQWVREHDVSLSRGTPPSGPRIALLYGGSASQNPAFTQGLVNGLSAVGYTPGRDISIIWRFADGRNELLPSLAAELVELRPDVIVAPVVAEAMAVKQVTSSIPIVTLTVADPVGAGLVASLDHPGGNVTGVIQQPLDFNNERLAFLKEAVPQSTRIGLLVASPANPATLNALRDGSAALGVELLTLEVQTADDLDTAFATAADESVDALMVFAGTLFTANRSRIVRLAAQHRIPALYPSRLFLESGGLMDYAFVEAARGRRAADYVLEILHGAYPGDLPMSPPRESELVVNLSAAEAIGYRFPPSVVARATEVLP